MTQVQRRPSAGTSDKTRPGCWVKYSCCSGFSCALRHAGCPVLNHSSEDGGAIILCRLARTVCPETELIRSKILLPWSLVKGHCMTSSGRDKQTGEWSPCKGAFTLNT